MGASTATVPDRAQDRPVAEIIRKSNRCARYIESIVLLFLAGVMAVLTYATANQHYDTGAIVTSAWLCGAFAAGAFCRFMVAD